MKKVFFLSMAAIAMLLGSCKENEPSVTNYNTYNTYNNVTPASELIPGELPGKFSVSLTTKVHFSQGNLQYNAKQAIWRFAEHQYHTIGVIGNAKIAADYDGYIDLFGWGTSGYNDKNPWMTSTTSTNYGDGTNNIAGTAYDWGVYNAIRNGGNETNLWRTMTGSEWLYLFHGRANAQKLFALGSVDGIKGTILLPDGWILPEGVTFNPSTENGLAWNSDRYKNTTSGANNYADNTYTPDEWTKMEKAGAVFLPAAGSRYGTTTYEMGTEGNYWSATQNSAQLACYLYIYKDYLFPQNNSDRAYGQSVRLVR